MTISEKKEIETKILEEIQKTEIIIADYKELIKPVAPDCAIGRISRMDAINNNSVTEAALRQSEKKLNALKYMRESINSKDFGLCQKCKQPIPLPRLLFMPQSRFCVKCAR
ncbi:MAG: TraR/DksA family transcriptional regulator [Chlorobi bacterium]|nr:TraR/DksA family transcriptional regulator [Chlorobiota bacterium]